VGGLLQLLIILPRKRRRRRGAPPAASCCWSQLKHSSPHGCRAHQHRHRQHREGGLTSGRGGGQRQAGRARSILKQASGAAAAQTRQHAPPADVAPRRERRKPPARWGGLAGRPRPSLRTCLALHPKRHQQPCPPPLCFALSFTHPALPSAACRLGRFLARGLREAARHPRNRQACTAASPPRLCAAWRRARPPSAWCRALLRAAQPLARRSCPAGKEFGHAITTARSRRQMLRSGAEACGPIRACGQEVGWQPREERAHPDISSAPQLARAAAWRQQQPPSDLPGSQAAVPTRWAPQSLGVW
jgi:hypothetical protein